MYLQNLTYYKMKLVILLTISIALSFCTSKQQRVDEKTSTGLTDKELEGNKPAPDASACSYKNDGSIDTPLDLTRALEIRYAIAEKHCEGFGGVNFETTQINAFERINNLDNKYILWNESVFCNCDE